MSNAITGLSTKDLTKNILILAGVTILVPTLAVMPGLGYALKPILKSQGLYPSDIDRTLKRLKKQKLISISYEGEQTKITLTENGKRKVLSFKLEEMRLKKGKWDGWWRIVIFDIPEKDRKGRNYLRNKMQELGFYMLQKSVLVTPWECKKEIDFIKHYYNLGDCVNLIKAKTFDGEDPVRNYFELD
ncbi:MAG: CRISPR-associated endonuclease Cas2 [Patescibacteria group bacterium]|nr:CRISPR-associated endonuclease Cas2 [Patescibacteria group bacterium]